MKPADVIGRRKYVDALVTGFISEALQKAVQNGDTDVEEPTNVPEVTAAERIDRVEMLTVNGGAA